MPKPIKGTGRYPPSVILEQHSTISSYESNSAFLPCEAVPTTVTSVEGKGLVLPPAYQSVPSVMATTPAAARLMPSAPYLGSQVSPPILTSAPPALSLEAILLERKRRLTTTSSNVSNSSTPVHFGPPSNPTCVPPSPVPSGSSLGFVNKDFGVSGGPAVFSTGGGSGATLISRGMHSSSGKGTMFKSSPLGGGDRVGVVAERLKAAMKSEDMQSSGLEDGEAEKAG